jgi:hypothetical protein
LLYLAVMVRVMVRVMVGIRNYETKQRDINIKCCWLCWLYIIAKGINGTDLEGEP